MKKQDIEILKNYFNTCIDKDKECQLKKDLSDDEFFLINENIWGHRKALSFLNGDIHQKYLYNIRILFEYISTSFDTSRYKCLFSDKMIKLIVKAAGNYFKFLNTLDRYSTDFMMSSMDIICSAESEMEDALSSYKDHKNNLSYLKKAFDIYGQHIRMT